MLYGAFDPTRQGWIVSDLLDDKKNGVIISTDLSHFRTEEEARRIDNVCLSAIEKKAPSLLHRGCEARRSIGVEAMLIAAVNDALNVKLLDCRTSSWVTNETDSVVGYASALFY